MTRTCPTPKWTPTSGVRRPGRRNALPWRSSLMSWRNITATNSSSPTETSFQPEVRAVNVLISDCYHGDGCSQILAARIVSHCCSPSRARPQPADCTACRGVVKWRRKPELRADFYNLSVATVQDLPEICQNTPQSLQPALMHSGRSFTSGTAQIISFFL